MRWQQTEFILKGVFLGLLVFVALQEGLKEKPAWHNLAYVAGCTLAGLVVFLGVAALRKLREGYRIKGRRLAFVLFLLLENPGLVYAGILIGMLAGAYLIREPAEGASWWSFSGSSATLGYTVAGGAALGVVFLLMRHVRDKKIRLGLGLGLATALVGGVAALFYYQEDLLVGEQRQMLGAVMILGIPVFYLLTFASMVEESEIEVAAMCAALGVGCWLLFPVGGFKIFGYPTTEATQIIMGALLPMVLLFVYTQRIMPGLRVYKHVFRGISYASVGRYRLALLSLGRALQLDPRNKLAKDELWQVHRQIDFDHIGDDKETLAVINFDLCLERAAFLLLNPPGPAQLEEAERLLRIVAGHRPEMAPRCDYWRAVACLHQKDHEGAAEHLAHVITGDDVERKQSNHRRQILLPAWRLALLEHDEMKKRVGSPQLAEPVRRMEAIAAVERHLGEDPNDSSSWELKRLLYQDLNENDYAAAVGDGQPARFFDYGYARELGMALIHDSAHWQRGAEYLRMAARGLPHVGPSLFVEIARAAEKAGEIQVAWNHYELAKQVGKAVEPANLSNEDRKLYFQVVKMLGDSANEKGDADGAIENYRLYLEAPDAGVETYRTLADLFEQKDDVWSALHATEHAFIHGKKTDADLVARKDKYYYSISPDDVRQRWENVQKWFDVTYCITKAKSILGQHSHDLDMVDWAAHLSELAYVAQKSNLTVRLLRARVRRLKGEIDEATKILEEIYADKPEKFPSSDEEDAWYAACKLLGDIYLNDKPDKAVECFQEFKTYPKSGADTFYKLGVGYEAMGDWAKAAKCYEQVTAYESHPLAPNAHDALDRLRAGSG